MPLHAQQIIDRVVATVNEQVITQSDWDTEERFEALSEGRPAKSQHSPAALERLIDRTLLLQQMAQLNFRPAPPDLVQAEVESIRKQLPAERAATDEAWKKTLHDYGIAQDDFEHLIAEQANVTRFIDVRFRSNARIAQFEIDNYYRGVFVPEFKKKAPASQPPPLGQVQSKIQEILIERRVTEGLSSFVQSLRAQAVIRYISPVTNGAAK